MSHEGHTTAQMREAPPGAAYFWPVHRSISYARELAQHLGRTDLRIVSPADLGGRLRGLDVPLVIDHAAPFFLAPRERAELREIAARAAVRARSRSAAP